MSDTNYRGILAALTAAALFGAGTPIAKLLLELTYPWLLAGLLYLGSGLGLLCLRCIRRSAAATVTVAEWPWLLGAIFAGGILAPALLMWGLSAMPASGAALLLNAESVFTALIAWFAFRENFDRRIALGMALIVAGAILLSSPGELRLGTTWPTFAVLGACLCWAIDNNLTRKVALADASYIAMLKGLSAGTSNLVLALLAGTRMPSLATTLSAGVLGFFSYGLSLTLFVLALRHLGTARTGAYFSVAPFFGAVLAVPLLGESITLPLLVAGALMALGVWLHVTERHDHLHTHTPLVHTHEHVHDQHHQHQHDTPVAPGARHTHTHRHETLTHSHPHYPDAHHQHNH